MIWAIVHPFLNVSDFWIKCLGPITSKVLPEQIKSIHIRKNTCQTIWNICQFVMECLYKSFTIKKFFYEKRGNLLTRNRDGFTNEVFSSTVGGCIIDILDWKIGSVYFFKGCPFGLRVWYLIIFCFLYEFGIGDIFYGRVLLELLNWLHIRMNSGLLYLNKDGSLSSRSL